LAAVKISYDFWMVYFFFSTETAAILTTLPPPDLAVPNGHCENRAGNPIYVLVGVFLANPTHCPYKQVVPETSVAVMSLIPTGLYFFSSPFLGDKPCPKFNTGTNLIL